MLIRTTILTRAILILSVLSLYQINSHSSKIAHAQTVEPLSPSRTGVGTSSNEPLNNHEIYNDHIVPYLPIQSREADIRDKGRLQEEGRGIKIEPAGVGQGLNLYQASNVCNDFNQDAHWASTKKRTADIKSDRYAGWGAFAFDDGKLFRSDNVIIARERVVGPGSKHDDSHKSEQFSAKISSTQPYAAGFGSPRIKVPAASEVTVSVKYMIFDHDTHGQDYDWASLGLKPDAAGDEAIYVNGYKRGVWAELSHTITAGESEEIMVLIQAHSPAALNSNIYFDDVKIIIDDVPLTDCLYYQPQ